MTTPADELRTAAEKLREVAAKATTGICPDWIYSAVRHVARNCQIECSHDEHQDWDQPEWDRYADWSYIAAMNPGVGLALADWLDVAAEHCRGHYLCCDNGPCSETAKPALAVARAINGGTR